MDTDVQLAGRREALGRWLTARLPACERVSIARIGRTGGLSHEILDVDARWEDAGRVIERGLIVRLDPVAYRKRQRSNLRREFDAQSVLYTRGDVPVPEPLWFEDDTEVLGAAFYVMERVAGQAATDQPPYQSSGWLAELPGHDRAQIWRSAVTIMARIHGVPAGAMAALGQAGSAEDDFQAHVAN